MSKSRAVLRQLLCNPRRAWVMLLLASSLAGCATSTVVTDADAGIVGSIELEGERPSASIWVDNSLYLVRASEVDNVRLSRFDDTLGEMWSKQLSLSNYFHGAFELIRGSRNELLLVYLFKTYDDRYIVRGALIDAVNGTVGSDTVLAEVNYEDRDAFSSLPRVAVSPDSMLVAIYSYDLTTIDRDPPHVATATIHVVDRELRTRRRSVLSLPIGSGIRDYVVARSRMCGLNVSSRGDIYHLHLDGSNVVANRVDGGSGQVTTLAQLIDSTAALGAESATLIPMSILDDYGPEYTIAVERNDSLVAIVPRFEHYVNPKLRGVEVLTFAFPSRTAMRSKLKIDLGDPADFRPSAITTDGSRIVVAFEQIRLVVFGRRKEIERTIFYAVGDLMLMGVRPQGVQWTARIPRPWVSVLDSSTIASALSLRGSIVRALYANPETGGMMLSEVSIDDGVVSAPRIMLRAASGLFPDFRNSHWTGATEAVLLVRSTRGDYPSRMVRMQY